MSSYPVSPPGTLLWVQSSLHQVRQRGVALESWTFVSQSSSLPCPHDFLTLAISSIIHKTIKAYNIACLDLTH